jgi:hypothetical protein
MENKTPMQETPEEVAKNNAVDNWLCGWDMAIEWQQKQDKKLYSEEDMKEAFRVGFNVGYNDEESPSYLTFEEWIKEYKKK